MDKKKTLLAFIRISGGSSWYQSEDNEPLELMALKAAKQAKQDWKHLFKFKKDGWVAQSFPSGIFPVLKNGKLGKKPCKFVKSIKLFY